MVLASIALPAFRQAPKSALPIARARAGARSFSNTQCFRAGGNPRPSFPPSHTPRQPSRGAGTAAGPQQAAGASWGGYYLFLASLATAALAGYYTNILLASGAPPLQFSLIDSKRAKELQLANQPKFGTHQDYLAAIKELRESWEKSGKGDRISTDESDLESHGISDWSYHGAHMPTVVVWVESTAEVQEIVRVATKWRVPITPFSGGTSLEGHFSSPYGGISMDFSNMDKILRLSVPDADITVQPGVKWEDLNKYLADKGVPLFFPLDPGPGATIGGMVGTGCSGTNAVRYGTAKAEWFLNLTVVLPSGEVIKTRQRARKSSAGFDTTKLFIGAEGTLGIVTEATLRLTPLLPTKVAVVGFSGVEEAVAAATDIVNNGMPVRALHQTPQIRDGSGIAFHGLTTAECVEFVDKKTVQSINQMGLAGRQYPERDSLFIKFQGSDSSMVEVSKSVTGLVKKHGGKNLEFSKTDKEAHDLWQGRKAALWSIMGLIPDCKAWTTDVCVPISKLPQLVRETSEDFDRRGVVGCHLGHVGDGNVHSILLFTNDEELDKIREGVHDMVHRAIRLDGTCTGEHGVGKGKIEYLEEELGEGTVGLMETIKRTLDPLDIMNPGNLYPNIKPVKP